MNPSSPIFEEDLPSPSFDDDPPPWLSNEDLSYVRTSPLEIKSFLEPLTPPSKKEKTPAESPKTPQPKSPTESPKTSQPKSPTESPKTPPPKSPPVKTPPPVLAKPKKKPPVNAQFVLPPLHSKSKSLVNGDKPKIATGDKPVRPISDDIVAKRFDHKPSEIIITNGMTNGKMSIGSPEIKNKQHRLFGDHIEKVEVKPYRSNSADDHTHHRKHETEVKLNPSFCLGIAEKRVLMKPRSTSLDFKEEEKLDSNQNKTKSLCIFSETHSTQTDPVDFDLNLTNGFLNGHCKDSEIKPKTMSFEKSKFANGHINHCNLTNGYKSDLEDIFSDLEKPKFSQNRSSSVDINETKGDVDIAPSRTHSVDTPEQLFSGKAKPERKPIVTGENSMHDQVPACLLDLT